MANRNCPNCAAPYDVTLNKCPYCGTSYFDMSCIDIDNHKPFYLKIKTGGYTVTAKVFASMDRPIEVMADYSYLEDWNGMTHRITNERHADFDLHFQSVVDPNVDDDKLFYVVKE